MRFYNLKKIYESNNEAVEINVHDGDLLVAGELDENAHFKIKRRKKRAISRKYGAFQCQVR